jgi:pyruvate/2-oxoglutarate/acetoin dehydrogenase E1 component
VVADPGWRSFGAAAEIIATVTETHSDKLRTSPRRICLPDSHTPMSSALERVYYPSERSMVESITAWLKE